MSVPLAFHQALIEAYAGHSAARWVCRSSAAETAGVHATVEWIHDAPAARPAVSPTQDPIPYNDSQYTLLTCIKGSTGCDIAKLPELVRKT